MSAEPARLMAQFEAEIDAAQEQQRLEASRTPDPMEGHALSMIVSGAGEAINTASQSSKVAVPPAAPTVKELATLKAKAALCGVVLYLSEGDRGEPLFIASRWSLTRQMHSVAEVEDFLARIGVIE